MLKLHISKWNYSRLLQDFHGAIQNFPCALVLQETIFLPAPQCSKFARMTWQIREDKHLKKNKIKAKRFIC